MPTKTMSAAKTCLSLFALVSTGLIHAGAFASTGTVYDDPLLPDQWQWDPSRGGIDVRTLWEQGITGRGVVVGIVDEWVEPNHEDVRANYNFDLSWDFVADMSVKDVLAARGDSAYTVDDAAYVDGLIAGGETDIEDESHGTFISGLIAGAGGNGIGGVGAAPEASLAGLHTGMDDELLRQGLRHLIGADENGNYVEEAKIHIKNNSWGDDSFYFLNDNEEVVSALEDSTKNGVINVFAAGNERNNGLYVRQSGSDDYMLGFGLANAAGDRCVGAECVIAVAATTSAASAAEAHYADFSNYGSGVFISAPGDDVHSTDRMGDYGYDPEGNYAFESGTSFAAPIVCGVLALGKQVCGVMDTRWAKHAIAHSSGGGESPNIDFREATPEDDSKYAYVERSEYATPVATGDWIRNTGGLWFNNNYGFGLIDPAGFVEETRSAAYVTTRTVTEVELAGAAESVFVPAGQSQEISFEVSAADLGQSVETIVLDISSAGFSVAPTDDLAEKILPIYENLRIVLVDPAGNENELWGLPVYGEGSVGTYVGQSEEDEGDADEEDEDLSMQIVSNAFWGENGANGGAGTWTLVVENTSETADFDFSGVSLTFNLGDRVLESENLEIASGETVNASALCLDEAEMRVLKGGTFNAESDLLIQGGVLDVAGTVGAVIEEDSGEAWKGAKLTMTAGETRLRETGEMTLLRGAEVCGGAFSLLGGRVNGDFRLAGAGKFSADGGVVAGTFRVEGGTAELGNGGLTLSSGTEILAGTFVTAAGETTLRTPSFVFGSAEKAAGAQGPVLNVGGAGAAGTLVVAGVDDASVASVNFKSGALLLDIDDRITVEGDVSVESGTTVYLNVSGESLIAANGASPLISATKGGKVSAGSGVCVVLPEGVEFPTLLTLDSTGTAREQELILSLELSDAGDALALAVQDAFSGGFIVPENLRLVFSGQTAKQLAVQEALLRAESAGDARGNGLRARVESAGTRTEILAVYEAAGTATNLIRIDELLSKQVAASVGAVSRRARDLRFGAASGSPASFSSGEGADSSHFSFAGAQSGSLSLWANGGYAYSEADADSSTAGTKTNLANIFVGVDCMISSTDAVGIFAGCTDGSTKFNGAAGRTDVQAWGIGAYLAGTRAALGGNVFYTASASVAFGDFDFERNVFGSEADASTDGVQGVFFVEGGYELTFADIWTTGPTASLRYVVNDIDGYEESAPEAILPLRVGDADYDSLQSSLGWRLACRLEPTADRAVIPEIRAAWNHEFLDTEESFGVGAAVSGAPRFRDSLVSAGDDYATLGAGVSLLIGADMSLSADYDVQLFRSGSDPVHSVNLLFRARF